MQARQNTAVLGHICFIEASWVALRGSARKMGKKTLKSWLGIQNSIECYTGRMQACNFADPKLPGE